MRRESSNESQHSAPTSTSSADDERPPDEAPPQQYEFLSGLDKSYSSNTRAHVLRRHMRARRRRGKQRAGPGAGAGVAVPALRPTARPHVFGERSNANASDSASVRAGGPFLDPVSIALKHRRQHHPQMTATSRSGSSAGEEDVVVGVGVDTGALVVRYGHPNNSGRPPMGVVAQGEEADELQYFPPVDTILGQGRVDPFSTFARPTTPRENFFIDHYITSSMSYYKLLRGTRFHPPRDICFTINATNEASLSAMIAYSAKNLGMNMPRMPVEALMYRTEGVRLINENLSDPERRLSDGNFLAVVGMIAYDKETTPKGQPREPSPDLHYHVQGFREMIIARGGLGVVVKEPAISWITHWMDMLNSGAITVGLTPLSTHAFCAPARLKIPSGGISSAQSTLFPAPDDIRPFAEEFIGVYGNLFREAQGRAATALMATLHPAAASYLPIHQIFRRGTPVHRLLTDPTTDTTISRNTVPFYLNLILWDCRAAPAVLVNRYFKRVRLMMVDEGLDVGGVVEVLFWVLMTDPDQRIVADPERMWLLGRLLWVENRLGKEIRKRLERALLLFLTAGGVDEARVEWEPEQFRRDVLAELALEDKEG